jgi:fucose 4-O-acetylase-like acetyltransferase
MTSGAGAPRQASGTAPAPRARMEGIDCLKGFAAFLVVLGHAFAPAFPGSFKSLPAFIFIYSFHMPLFMFLSGWLAFGKMGDPPASWLLRRAVKLIPVFIIWHALYAMASGAAGKVLSPGFWKEAVLSPDSPWYPLILLYCLCALLATYRLAEAFRGKAAFAYLAFFAFALCAPTPSSFGLIKVKWFSFFLVLGYVARAAREAWLTRKGTGTPTAWTVAAWLVFPAVFLAGYAWVPEPGNMDFALFRHMGGKPALWALYYASAISGIAFGFKAAALLGNTRLAPGLAWLGRRSLELYLLHGLFIDHGFGTGWPRVILATLASLAASVLAILILERVPGAGSLLFGFDLKRRRVPSLIPAASA